MPVLVLLLVIQSLPIMPVRTVDGIVTYPDRWIGSFSFSEDM